uniref:Uncharacterized protein n=1 Tax=Arundo donax TaxID=35708 RepID=A0A0A9ATV6_ARUDO
MAHGFPVLQVIYWFICWILIVFVGLGPKCRIFFCLACNLIYVADFITSSNILLTSNLVIR